MDVFNALFSLIFSQNRTFFVSIDDPGYTYSNEKLNDALIYNFYGET